MAEEYKCFYRVLLYRPDPFKQPINFGLILVAQREGERPVLLSRVTKSWGKLKAIDPAVDAGLLTDIGNDLPKLVSQWDDPRQFLNKLDTYCSSSFELGEERAFMSADPTVSLSELGSQHLRYGWGADSQTIREQVRKQMEAAFKQNGVWKLMKHDIALSGLTERTDPFTIDCGYAHEEHFKFFHALALSSQPDSGLALASRMSDIISSVAARHGLMTWFTAIVEDDLERTDPEIEFALLKMEKSEIHLAVAAELPGIAERARLELVGS